MTAYRALLVTRDGGLVSVPHADEHAGPESVRAVRDHFGSDHVRHGIAAIEDEARVAELAADVRHRAHR